jgi:energy-coupling factor transporter ATP-binding protein EcfA2
MRGKSAIKLTDVCFSYDGEEPQLNNLSLEIDKGECVLVTGASGCGKTTLTRLINGLIPHYYEGELTGDLQLNGKSTSTLADWEYGEQVGSVFQDARSQFFTSNVLDELAFASENYRLEAETITQRIDQVLELNRMDYLRNRKLSQLSSGEKQKVAMGAVEVHHPEIFVLDEPSANLDNQGNAQLAATVEQLKRTGKTVVIADHRIHYLMETADRIVYMAKGEIKVQWTIEEFRQLSEAQLHSYDIRERREIALAELLRAETAVKEPFLSLKDLAIGYHRLAPSLIKNLNIELSKGEIILFTGGNGLGKTTLARTLCGLNKEQAGAISIEGQLQSAKKRRRKCWFVLQDADYQLFSDSVLNELLLGMKKTEENQAKAEKLLKELNL